MSVLERGNTPQPVVDKDGKVVPGVFAFETISRNLRVEREISEFVLEAEKQEKLQKIEASK